MKAIKKLLLVGVIAGATVLAFKGTKVVSDVRNSVNDARSFLDSQEPVERKIAKLRKDAAALDKDMDKVAGQLAAEIVEVRALTKDTAAMQAAVDGEKKVLQDRLAKLEKNTGTETVSYGGRGKVTLAEAKEYLAADVKAHQNRVRELEFKNKTLAARERVRDAVQKQLDTLKSKKAELTTAIDAAEAKFKELQLAQMESKYQTDDTQLAKVKERLRELNKQLDIEAEKLKLTPTVKDDAPVAGVPTLEEIGAALNGPKKADASTPVEE